MEASLPSDRRAIVVRPATVDDVELLHRFSVDLATYEDEPDAVISTPQTLARDGFGKDPKFAALIAERAGQPIGFAIYTFNYSVWTGARGIFIEDIWVVSEERRGGVARALIQALAQECLVKGFRRIDLNVLDWNPARGFYERLGFQWIRRWLPYRLSGVALEKLARSSGTAGLQARSDS
jgi:GNAT superfamily N-acetyltransferase